MSAHLLSLGAGSRRRFREIEEFGHVGLSVEILDALAQLHRVICKLLVGVLLQRA
jgi:hypothetical protein